MPDPDRESIEIQAAIWAAAYEIRRILRWLEAKAGEVPHGGWGEGRGSTAGRLLADLRPPEPLPCRPGDRRSGGGQWLLNAPTARRPACREGRGWRRPSNSPWRPRQPRCRVTATGPRRHRPPYRRAPGRGARLHQLASQASSPLRNPGQKCSLVSRPVSKVHRCGIARISHPGVAITAASTKDRPR